MQGIIRLSSAEVLHMSVFSLNIYDAVEMEILIFCFSEPVNRFYLFIYLFFAGLHLIFEAA